MHMRDTLGPRINFGTATLLENQNYADHVA